MISHKRRVLVSAFSCCPNMGSEEGVGWNWVKQIARYNDVEVLTREKFRRRIESELTLCPLTSATFHYVVDPLGIAWLENTEIGIRLYYYYWQVLAFFCAKRIVRVKHVDLIHHVSVVMLALPPLLPLLPLPHIWNVAGGVFVPKQLLTVLGIRGMLFELLRVIGQYVSTSDPFVRIALKRSALILCSNKSTFRIIPEKYHSKTVIQTQIGIEKVAGFPLAQKKSIFRCIVIGRLVPLKGLELAVRAFHNAWRHNPNLRLTIVGEGPERSRIRRLIISLGLSEVVLLTGEVENTDVMGLIRESDILLFTSLRESAGMVILEALSFGKPVVCLAHGGSGDLVDPWSGIKVEISSLQDVIRQLADAILKLSSDIEFYDNISKKAYQKVKDQFLWDSIGERIPAYYDQAVRNFLELNR